MLRTTAILLVLCSTAFGVWTNPLGGENINYYGDEVRWGIPIEQEQSGLNWEELPILTGTFPLGKLDHFNYVVAIGSAPTAIDLTTHGMTFTLGIDETPNAAGPPWSDDLIYLGTPLPSQGSLSILGWGRTPDDLSTVFRSPENATNWTYLWANKPIPAPSAAMLVLVGLGAIVRRKQCG